MHKIKYKINYTQLFTAVVNTAFRMDVKTYSQFTYLLIIM